MDGIPNTLIGDDGEMARYKAKPPGTPAATSADQLVSQFPKGQQFAAADKNATDRVRDYCLAADRGIRGYKFQADNAAAKYMDNEQLNVAQFQGLTSIVDCGIPPNLAQAGPAASLPEQPGTSGTPTTATPPTSSAPTSSASPSSAPTGAVPTPPPTPAPVR